jgi:hypothetical protein
MVQFPLLINLDKKTFDDLHNVIGLTIEKQGITIFRLFDSNTKQECYRQIIREGIRAKIEEFERIKKEKNES